MSGHRGGLPGMPTPHPLGQALPGPYLTDDLTQRWMAALDEVLAPVLVTLDCLDSYVDPRLAPTDLVDWLAGWVAVRTSETASQSANRAWVGSAVDHHRRRGTAAAVADELRQATGLYVEVAETGATTWSTTPGGPLPGQDTPGVMVRVHADDAIAVDLAAIEDLVVSIGPAHVAHAVEVTTVPT